MSQNNGHDKDTATAVGGKPLDEAIETCLDHLRLIKPLLEQRRAAYLATEKLYYSWLAKHSELDRKRAESAASMFKRITRQDVKRRSDAEAAKNDLTTLAKKLDAGQLDQLLAMLEGLK